MDYGMLQLAATAVLSPVLFATGVLYILSTAHVQLTAILFNFLTLVTGTIRFTAPLPLSYRGPLTVLFVLFLILALVADLQWMKRLLAPKAQVQKAPVRRVRIESPNSWVVSKNAGERRAYRVPKLFLEKHSDYLWSDLKFRITCDDDPDPIEGGFTINEKFYILLPEELLTRLQKSKTIHFEILE